MWGDCILLELRCHRPPGRVCAGDTDANTGADTGTNTGADTGANTSAANTSADTGTDTGANTDTGTNTGTDVGSDTRGGGVSGRRGRGQSCGLRRVLEVLPDLCIPAGGRV